MEPPRGKLFAFPVAREPPLCSGVCLSLTPAPQSLRVWLELSVLDWFSGVWSVCVRQMIQVFLLLRLFCVEFILGFQKCSQFYRKTLKKCLYIWYKDVAEISKAHLE